MGEIADDLVNGRMCSQCGCFFEKEHGYPVLCPKCWSDEQKEHHRKKKKYNGPSEAIYKIL